MNRAQRRAAAKVRHRLIPWPKHRDMPLKIDLSDEQRAWTCSCRSGWLTITSDDPAAAFEQHVATACGVKVDV